MIIFCLILFRTLKNTFKENQNLNRESSHTVEKNAEQDTWAECERICKSFLDNHPQVSDNHYIAFLTSWIITGQLPSTGESQLELLRANRGKGPLFLNHRYS